MSDPDIEELRQQSSPGDRASNASDGPSLQDHFIDALDEVEGNQNKKTLSAREGDLAALARGLEADEGELERVVTTLQEARGKGDDVNRQELIIAAAWVGLKEECGDVVEEFEQAKKERVTV